MENNKFNELTKNLDNYLKYDKKINEINDVLKKLKEQKGNLEKDIIQSIEKNKLKDKVLKINNFKFTYNESETIAPLSLSIIEDAFNELNFSNNIKSEILKKIKQKREENKKKSIHLKRKVIKRKMSKNK